MVRARFSPRSGGDKFGVRNVTSVANEVRQILWPDGDDAISAIDAIRWTYFKGLSLAVGWICALLLLSRHCHCIIGRQIRILYTNEDIQDTIRIITIKIYDLVTIVISRL